MSSDEDEDENSKCPICFDTFKFPKLLPCRHTFCKTCLDIYSEQKQLAEDENSFPCPMCRSTCKIPKGGVRNFPTNFFVKDKILNVGHLCPKCNDRLPSEDTQCRRCVTEEMKSEEADASDSESVSFDHYSGVPFSFLMHLPTARIVTNFRADLVSTAALGDSVLHVRERITALGPTNDNKCWVVLECRPEMFKIDTSGEIIRHMYVDPPMVIFDVACRRDGKLLLLVMRLSGVRGIMSMDENNGTIEMVSVFRNFQGHDMALFSDGRIIVIGKTTSHAEESEEETRNETIMIISENGNQIRQLHTRNIMHGCVTISPATEQICLTDPSGGCVDVLLENGKAVGHCKFDNPFLSLFGRGNLFRPVGICCDNKGYIIVCDQASSSLLVLTPTGQFCGLVTAKTSENFENTFGSPYLVACSSSGYIWVGDRENGETKVFNIIDYINSLDGVLI